MSPGEGLLRAGHEQGVTHDDAARIEAAALFRLEAGFVARVIARLGVPERDQDDAVQEVFLTVHRRGGFTPDKAKARTWLAEIAVRVAANVRRTRRRKPTTSPDELDTVATHGPDPYEATAQRERIERVAQTLEALPSAQRQVFVLYEIDGEPCETIAQGLGVPVGTVYSRLHGARRAFHTVFQGGEKRLLAGLVASGTAAVARTSGAAVLGKSWTGLFLSKLLFAAMTIAMAVSFQGEPVEMGAPPRRWVSAQGPSTKRPMMVAPAQSQVAASKAERAAEELPDRPRPAPSYRPTRKPRSIAEDLREVTELKRLARQDPAAALQRMQKVGPAVGVLGEEREILAIEALAAIGKITEAKRQAAAFIARHPESPYLARARQVNAQPTSAEPSRAPDL